MCGFTGFWQGKESLAQQGVDHHSVHTYLKITVEAMANRIAYRGPDGMGVWSDHEVGLALAHRRLSIIDTSSHGHQPMLSPSGRYVIVFNGEVYNAPRLRPDLEAKGYTFHGHSDTEIMLAMIEEHGLIDAVSHFIGMFAFALWDRQNNTLFLVRDRAGIKPLYYGVVGNAHDLENGTLGSAHSTLFFGSQLASFMPHPAWQGDIDTSAVRELVSYNYIPQSACIYKGMRKVQPGTIVALHQDEAHRLRHEVHTYWSMKDAFQKGLNHRFEVSQGDAYVKDDTVYQHEVHTLLRDSVSLRQISDVPLGAFLSGGIDSSLVVALMAEASTQPVQTFTIGFHENQFDESRYAQDVAQHLGTQHTCEMLSHQDALNIIPDLPKFYDEPFADASQIPTYLVSAIARKHVTVALSGDGGDEFFGGYTRYHMTQKIYQQFSGMSPKMCKHVGLPILHMAQTLLRMPGIGPRLTALLSRMTKVNNPAEKIKKLYDIIDMVASHAGEGGSILQAERELLKHIFHGTYRLWQPREVRSLFPDTRGATSFDAIWDQSYLNNMVAMDHMQLCDALMYLEGDILTKVDRASMAHSLEARDPLLDHRLIEKACELPLRLKVDENGRGKIVLRSILKQYIPEHLIERPKQGFGVPINAWLKGPLRDWAQDLLSPTLLKGSPLEAGAEMIQRKLNEHTRGVQDHGYALWGVLMYQAWAHHQQSKNL